MTWLFCARGLPTHIRSDNGSEFTATRVRDGLSRLNAGPLFIEQDSPWAHGTIESFNGKLRAELLDGEICYPLKEAQVLIEDWRRHDNTQRPHSSLNYRPSAPEATPVTTHHPRPESNLTSDTASGGRQVTSSCSVSSTHFRIAFAFEA